MSPASRVQAMQKSPAGTDFRPNAGHMSSYFMHFCAFSNAQFLKSHWISLPSGITSNISQTFQNKSCFFLLYQEICRFCPIFGRFGRCHSPSSPSGSAYDTSAFGLRGDFRPRGKYLRPKVKFIILIPKAKLETEPTPATFC